MKKLLIIFTLLSGYSFGQSVGEGIGYQGVIKTPQYQTPNEELLIFTEKPFADNNNKQIYMGCLNCDKAMDNSIFNKYGEYGTLTGTYSLWNVNSPYSVNYNKHIVVSRSGKFYGYLTMEMLKSFSQ